MPSASSTASYWMTRAACAVRRYLRSQDLGLRPRRFIDAAAVGAYASEAVAPYDEFKANTAKVLNPSRAAGRRKKPKAGE